MWESVMPAWTVTAADCLNSMSWEQKEVGLYIPILFHEALRPILHVSKPHLLFPKKSIQMIHRRRSASLGMLITPTSGLAYNLEPCIITSDLGFRQIM